MKHYSPGDQGGYNLNAISESSLAVAQVLLGETPAEFGSLVASEIATEVMWQAAKVQSKYWKNIDLKACEPPEGRSSQCCAELGLTCLSDRC